MPRRDAAVWIAPTDATDEGNVLGAANATASRLELVIVDTIRGQENESAAIAAARRHGTLIIPALEVCVLSLAHGADLLETARRDGWRLLILDLGADSAAPSGTLVIEQFRELAAVTDGNPAFPVPPAKLQRRVGLAGQEFFRASGFVDTERYLAALREVGGSVAEPGCAILEWGAGCGRMTRHLRAAAPGAHITAVDIDTDALDWLRTHIPVHEVIATGIDPPLPFADTSFDVVIVHSVFTHIDCDAQDRWLAEIARVTRPEGTVLISTHGQAALRWHVEHPLVSMAGAIGAALPSLGFFFWRGEGWEADFHDGYHTAFHEPSYIREHWARWFTVLDVKPAGLRRRQDLVVLRPLPI